MYENMQVVWETWVIFLDPNQLGPKKEREIQAGLEAMCADV